MEDASGATPHGPVGLALRSFLQALWAVIGEAARNEDAERRGAMSRQGRKRKAPWSRQRIHVVRIATTINWLLALLSGRGAKPVIQRTIDWRVAFAPPSLTVTADASPWGMGAILATPDGRVLAWIASELCDMDCRVLRVERGGCRAQAAVEGLALLIALRAWAPL